MSGDNLDLELYARRKLKEKQLEEEIEEKGLAPVGSLMFSEVERRIDTIVFRSCFAHSIYEARRLIIHGDVKLNGKKVCYGPFYLIYQSSFTFFLFFFKQHTNATTRLAPGDMISVNPEAIRFFKRPNGEYDDINAGENRIRLTEEEEADEAETDAEQTSESPLESQTTSDPPIEDEVTDKAKTDTEQTPESPLEPQTTFNPPIEDEVADKAETDAEQTTESPLESHTTSESQTKKPKPKAKRDKTPLTPFYLPPYASPWLFIPAYIEPSFATCSVVYVRHPTARPGYSEIPTPYDADGTLIRYAWEWYMQRRPRMRSKSQLSRMPEDRTKIPIDVGEERRLLMQDVKPFRNKGFSIKGDVRKYAKFGSQYW